VPEADRPRRLADFDNLPFIMYAPDKARYFHDLLVGLFTTQGPSRAMCNIWRKSTRS
jgi:hypothetical protein